MPAGIDGWTESDSSSILPRHFFLTLPQSLREGFAHPTDALSYLSIGRRPEGIDGEGPINNNEWQLEV